MKERKEKPGVEEETSSAQVPRSTQDEQVRAKDNTKTNEKRVSSQDMRDRARKSYHHDGPGGSYSGY